MKKEKILATGAGGFITEVGAEVMHDNILIKRSCLKRQDGAKRRDTLTVHPHACIQPTNKKTQTSEG